jgi:hypothetical protein
MHYNGSMYFYHIDRCNALELGKTYNLLHIPNLDSATDKMVNELFPEGVSWWGDGKLLCDESLLIINNVVQKDTVIDLIFELVRKAYFPEKPSRYQSLFAFATLSDAKNLINTLNWPADSKIWKIKADLHYKVNMNLLTLDGRPVDIYRNAFAYWNGEPGDDANPFWELLVPYPITVIDSVYYK